MAVATIEPNDVTGITYDAWPRTGGTTKVDVMTDGSDITFVNSTGTSEVRQGWFWTDILGAAKLDAFTFTWRGQNNTANHAWRMFIRIGGADDDSVTGTNFPIGSFADRTLGDADGLTIPSPGNFNAAEIGIIRLAGAAVNSLTASKASASVTYTPAAGGFAYLMGCWLPPLLAVASHGLALSDLAQFLSTFKVRPGGSNTRYELDTVRRLYLVRPRFAF